MRRALIAGLLLMAALPVAAKELKVRKDMLVTADWLQAHLRDDPGTAATFFGKKETVVLQIGRTREGYDRGHIPGARYVGIGELAVTQNGLPNELPDDVTLVRLVRKLGLDRHKRIILYDDEDGLLAARAWFTLDFVGLGDRAALLDGGWKAWQAGGRPVSTAPPPPPRPTAYKPRMPDDQRVLLPEVREISHEILEGGQRRAVIIDARPEAQFSGTEKSPGTERSGHIPGAHSVYWKQALAGEQNPVLRPPDELRALFAPAGVRRTTTAITYCTSGIQGAFDYFVLKYLGYDARLYDGSFIEWSRARDTKVESGK